MIIYSNATCLTFTSDAKNNASQDTIECTSYKKKRYLLLYNMKK